jgi:hypothetical protein
MMLDDVGLCGMMLDDVGLCGMMLDDVGLCGMMLDDVGLCGMMLDDVGLCGMLLDDVGCCWMMPPKIHSCTRPGVNLVLRTGWRVTRSIWWLIICDALFLPADSRSSQPSDSLFCGRRWHLRKRALSTDQFKLKVISRSKLYIYALNVSCIKLVYYFVPFIVNNRHLLF